MRKPGRLIGMTDVLIASAHSITNLLKMSLKRITLSFKPFMMCLLLTGDKLLSSNVTNRLYITTVNRKYSANFERVC